MTATNQVTEPVSPFPITAKITKSPDMVNVKALSDYLFRNAAMLTDMPIPGPCTPSLPFPVFAIVGSVTTAPGWTVRATPIVRFPITKALTITEMMGSSVYFVRLPNQCLSTPIALDRLTIVLGVILAPDAFASKGIRWFQSSSKLIPCHFAFEATEGTISPRGLNKFNLSTTLAHSLNFGNFQVWIPASPTAKPARPSPSLKWFTASLTNLVHWFTSLKESLTWLAEFVKWCGSGTTGLVCRELGLRFVGLDISGEYLRDTALVRSERLTPDSAMVNLPLFELLQS